MADLPDSLDRLLEDRYRIEHELGQGGMATVYLAHDLRHDRQVAIKVLHPDLAAALGAERFLSEIKTTARLQHPHILPLLDSGKAGASLYYVMPYVSGETLRARLTREKQLPVADAVRIAREVADALGEAHAHGIVHRDIKPENILLQGGHAMVADFGIALAVQQAQGTRMTQTGLSLGTPQYMSPEQAMGEKSLDARTDLYALGAVTYEMLTGDPPFTGSTVQAIVAKIVSTEPERISTIRKTVPPHVEAAVHTALAKLPADRFATAADFASALSGFTSATMPEGRPATARRRPPLTMALGAAVLVLAALLAWTALRPRARSRAAEPVIRFGIELPPLLNMVGARGLSGSTVAVSPDGSLVAFIADESARSRRIYVRTLDNPTPRPVEGSDGALVPFFSPDGAWLGFWTGGRLFRVDLNGGAPQPLSEVPQPSGVSWSPSGEIVVAVDRRLVTVPAGGGPMRPLTTPDSAHGELLQQAPMALPDGKHVLYASWNALGMAGVRIGIASMETGRSTVLDLTGSNPLGMVDGWVVYNTADGALLAARLDVSAARVTGKPIPLMTGLLSGSGGMARAGLSPSGTFAYVAGSRETVLSVAGADGTVTPILPETRLYGYPRYSPDGRRIAYALGTGTRVDIWVYDLASHTPIRLTTGASVNERPEWTPDGRRVIYRSDQGSMRSVWWVPADLSGPPEPLIATARDQVFEAVITPDGKQLVYQEDSTGADVWYRALSKDSVARPVANSRFIENMARVSPNGRWVALVSDESGSGQVLVQPFPGPGPRVQVSTAGGTEPVWSRDGKRIFYRGDQKIMVATVATTPAFSVTGRSVFMRDEFMLAQSPHANYDVAPDGQHLLVLKGQLDPRLFVVHNWGRELRERVARAVGQ